MTRLYFQMSEFFIIAASSVYWANEEKPHLFPNWHTNGFAIRGASINSGDPSKKVETIIKHNSGIIKGRKIILWHDVVNNSLSTKKYEAMAPSEFFTQLNRLKELNVVGFTYLFRAGAQNLQKHWHLCPSGITYLHMKVILTKRYRLLMDPDNDLHLNSVLEAHMVSRVTCCTDLRQLTHRRKVNRKQNLQNKVSYD